MPTITAIRNGLLHALQTALSEAQSELGQRLLLARIPLHVPDGVTLTPLDFAALPEPESEDQYPLGQRWPQYRLNSISIPYMACVIRGEADLRIGVTAAMMEQARSGDTTYTKTASTPGGYVVSLTAPATLLIPPGVPYAPGVEAHWERPQPEQASSHILWIRFLPEGALCHTCRTEGTDHKTQLALLIKDTQVLSLVQLLAEELRERPLHYAQVASSQLVTILLRLWRAALMEPPAVALGLTPWMPSVVALGLTSCMPSSGMPPEGIPKVTVVQNACSYIQLHLHEPLTLPQIASHVHLTPTHLNRIFRNAMGTSVMQYFTRQRLDMSKALLQHTDMSIQEISYLCGYARQSHFSDVFTRQEGISPLKFRHMTALAAVGE
jgi:AraC-like DNA-binding protein